MLFRRLKLGFKLLTGLILCFAIFIGAGAWWLTSGHPIHLGFLAPILQRSLNSADNPLRLEFDDIVIAWIPGKEPLGLQALGLRAYTKDGTEVGNIRRVGFRVSIPALLQGKVAPSSIEVYQIAIHFHRDAGGKFKVLSIGSDKAGDDHLPPDQLMDILLAGPKSNRIDGYLRKIAVVGGSLSFQDDVTGLSWHAPKVDIELTRGADKIDANVVVQVAELGNPAEIDVSASLDGATHRLEVNGRYHGIDIASLGLLIPALISAANSNLQFAGTFDTSVDFGAASPARMLGPVRFTLTAGPGTFDMPEYFSSPLPITKLALSGGLEAGLDSLTLQSLALDLGGPFLDGKARISGLATSGGPLRVQCTLKAGALAVADVPRFWPLNNGQSPGARNWFQSRMDRGKIESADATLDIAIAPDSADGAQILAFNATMKASGVSLRYAPQMPPIRDARVNATFDASKATFDIVGGGVGKLAIEKARATIGGLDQQTQSLEVAGDIAGPLPDTLLLLDQAGAINLDSIGIKAADTAGNLSANLHFAFPDLGNISIANSLPVVSARITGARVAGLSGRRELSDGDFDLKFDPNGITAEGSVSFGSIRAEVRWDQAIGSRDARTRIEVTARPTADDLAALGFDVRQEIQGAVPVSLVYQGFANRRGDITIDADFTPAALAFEIAKWRKAPGVPAQAGAIVELNGNKPTAISSFSFSAENFSARGQGRFNDDGGLAEIVFDRIALGRTKLRDVAIAFGPSRFDINVGGGDFDAEPYRDKGESLGIAARTSAAAGDQTESEARPFAFNVTAEHLDRIFLGEGREIDSLKLLVANDGKRIQSLEADGILRGGSPFQLRWRPSTPSTHSLSLTAGDAGGTLKALNIFDNVVGGRLTITGTSPDGEPGQPITGHVEISQYRLVGQSFLLRLFTIATLTGLADGLTSDGLLMRRFVADFQRTRGRVDVPLARTYGPSLALTATGYFDFTADSIDINGAIVPANALNSLVGQVPLVGFLLTGNNGNGVGSATYTATGKLSEPTFAVQPLSAIEPAFLRSIFDLSSKGTSPP